MNVLYLEDNAVFAQLVTRHFLKSHTVTIVPSLALAREALAAGGFDLVISDYDLEAGKGDAFVRECRMIRPLMPIVAASSHEAGNAALLAARASAICSKKEFNHIQEVIAKLEQEMM